MLVTDQPKGTRMFLEIFAALGGYYAYRKITKGQGKTFTDRAHRSEAIGAAGEAAAQAALRKTLYWLCGNDFYLHDGPLVIEHAPGTTFPTAEIDHLAVTPFGIFIFETKAWSGSIRPSLVAGMLTRTAPNGLIDDRRCPLAQNRSKIRFLREQFPRIWPVSGAGLFTSLDVTLDPGLSADIVGLGDLPQWLRSRKDAFTGGMPVSVEHAKKAVLMYADGSRDAIARHKRNVCISRQ